MWKHVWLGLLLILIPLGSSVHAQTIPSALDRVEIIDEGLSLRLVCSEIVEAFNVVSSSCGIDQMGEFSTLNTENFLNRSGADALGRWYVMDVDTSETSCGQIGINTGRVLRLSMNGTPEVVVNFPVICTEEQTVQSLPIGITVDPVNGKALLSVRSAGTSFPFLLEIFELEGLPTLLDIIPTFQPASETLSWITPKHPEALPAADNFQVYAGNIDDLRRDRDFTSAVPVDCSMPDVGPPAPGDYLSILDPLNPAKGKVEYAIIGVEHQSRLRLGRQSMGDELTGRGLRSFLTCS